MTLTLELAGSRGSPTSAATLAAYPGAIPS